jgi:hypothetical protein
VTSSASDDERKPAQPGALVSRISMVLGILWIVGCVMVAFALIGANGIAALTLIQGGALAAAALLPALMAWFAGAAAHEAARARAEAQRLADAADRLLNPQQSAEEAGRRLAMSVRSEISSLDHALEKTLQRLKEVEGVIGRQAETVDQMAGTAKESAGAMITGMEREREQLLKISRDLNNQAQSIGSSISRHTQSISEAARQAEAEVRAADQALDHRLTSFGAAAALITDRTQALSGAAQTSADSALRLEQALSNALDVLAKATHLTDAARQSAEAATLAANSTAGAVRDTTSRAIDDAKRAADLIRGEAVNVEREAAAALERLRDAAEAARSAAIGARSAVEDEEPRARPPRQRTAPPPEQHWRDEPDPLEAAPPPRYREPALDESPFGEPPPRGDRPAIQGGEWTWRDLLSSVDEGDVAKPKPSTAPRSPSRRAPAEDAVSRLTHQISDPRGPTTTLPVADMVSQAGMRIDEVFSASGLERVAQRARSGTQARRRAVKDAAPDAVQRMAEHLARNATANQEAMRFLRNEGARIAELLSRGRASMNAEATRAFLLIDSAAG